MVVHNGSGCKNISAPTGFYRKDSSTFYDKWWLARHVIKDMKAACKGANVVCDMQIQFDSTGGSNLETPQEQINEWIQSVKNLL